MHPFRSIRRLALGAALAGAAIGAVPAVAKRGDVDCIYDPVTRTATRDEATTAAPTSC